MFFSAKELHAHLNDSANWDGRYFAEEYGSTSLYKIRKYVAAAKRGIIARESEVEITIGPPERDYWDGKLRCPTADIELYKWYRPWEVVPALKNFTPPVGDHGIGVEVEFGFNSLQGSQKIAKAVSKWKYIALDIEGGDYPIEATFPPVLLSKLNSKSQVFRYLKLLRDNIEDVQKHHPSHMVGTHVNVSKGGVLQMDQLRADLVGDVLHAELSEDEQYKYFGRRPYGGCNSMGKYIEYKLFNSTTDSKAVRKYINVAVALTDLICSSTEITEHSVRAALESGYTK